MKLPGIIALSLLCPLLALATDDNLQDRLRYRLDTATDAALEVSGQPLLAVRALHKLYQQRDYQLLWQSDPGLAQTLLRWIDTARAHGLDPDDYHRAALLALNDSRAVDLAGLQVDRDLLLSDAALMLTTHLLAGRVNPKSIDPEWHADMRGGDVVAMLGSALTGSRLEQHFVTQLPAASGYRRLLDQLARLRQQPQWPHHAPPVAGGAALKRGQIDSRVAQLRARLLPNDAASDVFDERLEQAVLGFQQAHGLNVDGIAGPHTLALLNQSAADLVDLVRVNLERWRWLPEDLGERHILVNIPDFRLIARSSGQIELSMPVIVGRDYRRTPVFSAPLRYVVLNPYWEVPHSIATKDLIPKFRADPDSFHALGYELLEGWGAQQRLLSPKAADWAGYQAGRFPYRLRQRPGPNNALGKAKFMLPNSFAVYLHDTAQPELFSKEVRSFSSGCIRLSKPDALLAWVTDGRTKWPQNGQIVDQTISLKRSIPVHIQYWTAWVDEAGALQRRHDIYQRDAAVLKALNSPPARR